MSEKKVELSLGEHVFAIQDDDGTLLLYETLDEMIEDSEADETIYELYVYRQIDVKQAT